MTVDTTFDTTAPLLAIQNLMDSVLKAAMGSPPTASLIKIGAPETFPTSVAGYVAVGGHRPGDRAYTGVLMRDQDYFGAFGYRVKGAEATAELTIAAAIDELTRRFYVARGGNGTPGTGLFATATTQVTDAELDASLGSSPEYREYGTIEQRIWPFLITVTQKTTVSILADELDAE